MIRLLASCSFVCALAGTTPLTVAAADYNRDLEGKFKTIRGLQPCEPAEGSEREAML